MELNVYFQSVGDLSFNKDTIGSSIDVYSENKFPCWEDADIVLIGVQEDRNSRANSGSDKGQDLIRSSFYNLYAQNKFKIADLGNACWVVSLHDFRLDFR